MARTVLRDLDELRASVGRHLGYSGWLEVGRDRVDLFAEATGGEPGATTVPGFLVCSVSNLFLPEIVDVQGTSMGVNYGVESISFPTPVPVGARLRAGAEVAAVAEVAGGVQATVTITVEVEGADQPACVIQALNRYLA